MREEELSGFLSAAGNIAQYLLSGDTLVNSVPIANP